MTKKIENILLFMWSVALTATIGSLYFSEIRGYEPCELCWYQRILMYPLVIILGVAYAQKNAKIALTSLIFSVIGGCISAYHYSIQKLSFMQETAPTCGRVPCTGEYINYLGFITIPFLALIAFILIAISSVLILRSIKEEKKG
ncbi:MULTISPECIES: disulfide oxidoreductase [Bacillaceae]|uniref:disulfide oxidoreductase n=1 Tax=Bacillaceae TaxID=186817 RepID=UPI0006FD6588|nr:MULTISPECIES: disulfide oxidoreductase [Bacillaceae]KQL33213.1 disulfide bond formation protein DsbB [Psychrobacillus sp. FJAT-21963]MDF2065243.1 disulfide oxidoreductase [Bacillus sp. Cr_A10]